MDIDTEKQRPIEQVLQSIKELTEQITNDFSDIKEDISFIKQRIEEKEQEEKEQEEKEEEDKYKILDNNREPEVSKGWLW